MAVVKAAHSSQHSGDGNAENGSIWDDPASAEKYRAELEEKVWAMMRDNYKILMQCEVYGITSETLFGDEIQSKVSQTLNGYIEEMIEKRAAAKKAKNFAEADAIRNELLEKGIKAEKIIAVHKPYMEKRLWAAMQVYWPDVQAVYTSPDVTVEEHIAHAEKIGMTRKGVIETIVGDVQRMELYAQKGYQRAVEIPDEVRAAFDALVAEGYTGQLAK